MSDELDKTIEELEAEVIAELEEASAANDPQKKGSTPAEGQKKIDKKTPGGEVQDGGKPVVDPEAKSSPTDVAADDADEISGDAQQKGEKPAEPMKKVKKVKEDKDEDEDEDEEDEDDEVAEKKVKEAVVPKKTKAGMQDEMITAMKKMKKGEMESLYAQFKKSGDDEEEEDEDEDQEAVENAKKEAVELRIREIDVSEDVSALVSDEDSLSEEFKEKATTIFEAAVKSRVRSEVERIVEETAEEKMVEMETFKDELTEKVDTYLNYVVDEWSKENELAIERGLKGEIAEDFISGLQQLFQDHYIDVPDEKYDVLEAQSEKISELEDRLNEEIQKNVEVKEANSGLVREQVISEVSEDLADTEVEKFKTLTSDLDFSDEDTFREKLNTIKENYFPKVVVEDNVSDDETDGSAQDIVTSVSMEKYMTAISRNKARAS